jgi:hypothetical protein
MRAIAQRFIVRLSAVVALITVVNVAASDTAASTTVGVASGATLHKSHAGSFNAAAIPCAYACFPCYGDWYFIETVWEDPDQEVDSHFGHGCEPSEENSCNCLNQSRSTELASVLDARKADGATLAKLLADHSELVTLNTERHAIQVKGCAPGTLSAHIPISTSVMAELQRHTTQ